MDLYNTKTEVQMNLERATYLLRLGRLQADFEDYKPILMTTNRLKQLQANLDNYKPIKTITN